MAGGRAFILVQKGPHQLVQGGALVQVLALGLGLGLGDQRQQTLRVAVEQVKQDRVLALVVVVQPRLGGAAGGGDLVHAGGGVTAVSKALRCNVEDRVALDVVGG